MTNTNKIEQTTAHTPGPWEDNGNGLIYGQCSGDDDEAPFVADVCNDPNAYTEPEQANARRICATVNACQGLSIVVLEQGIIQELLKALKACELQLHEYVHWHHTNTGGCSVEIEDAWDQARAAIAKATAS
jgi:hypothetical protein